MVTDWSIIIAAGALIASIFALLSKSLDKNLSIREHEAYKSAVERDIARVEARLSQIEGTRPTTGELEILSESLNKRIDELTSINHLRGSGRPHSS